MNEQELITRARKGDHQAFMLLLRQYDRDVMGVVCRFTANLFDRKDLYQSIFLACFTSMSSFKAQSSFKTWLYRLALNQCLSFVRRRQPSDPLPERAQEPLDMEQRARLTAVFNALSRLRGPQRICFHLFYIEDWDQERIAEVLNCRMGTVKSHLNRARKKIRIDKEVMQWQTRPI